MQLDVEQTDETILVTLRETRLDAAIATRFKDRMRAVVAKDRRPVTIDMGHVDFMDSSGLGAMIAVLKAMPPGVALSLSDLTPNVARVFRLTRMDSVFAILPPAAEREEKRA